VVTDGGKAWLDLEKTRLGFMLLAGELHSQVSDAGKLKLVDLLFLFSYYSYIFYAGCRACDAAVDFVRVPIHRCPLVSTFWGCLEKFSGTCMLPAL